MNDLGFWMAMFVFGALIYFETPVGRLIRAGARLVWDLTMPKGDDETDDRRLTADHRYRRRIPIRRANGQLAGSVSTGNSPEPSPDRSSAVGSGVPEVPKVPEFRPIPIPDMLIIAARLGQGMTATEVAKSLPGYSGRKYAEYGERVRHVKAILEEHGALSSASDD